MARYLALWIGALVLGSGASPERVPRAERPFPDVPMTHWAYPAVEELRRLGILVGYPPRREGEPRRPGEASPPAPERRRRS